MALVCHSRPLPTPPPLARPRCLPVPIFVQGARGLRTDTDCPLYLGFTPANVDDITAAKAAPASAGTNLGLAKKVPPPSRAQSPVVRHDVQAGPRVKLEGGLQHTVLRGDATDRTQRVIAGDPAFRAHVAEKSVPSIIPTPHRRPFLAVDPLCHRIRCARFSARV